jgi:protein TonB
MSAAAFVVAMHIGGTALALMRWPADDGPNDPSGSVVIELAPLPVSAARDQENLPIGPESQEQAAADPAAKEAKIEPEKELPHLEKSPAPEPEVAMPEHHPEKVTKPEEDKPQETATDSQSDAQAAVAQMTTAPPKVDAEEGQTTAAPAAGLSAAPAKVVANWEKLLVTHLNRHKRYPGAAQAKRIQGTADVVFTIDRGGRVTERRVLHSSGSSLLDEEALEVLKRANPLPAPPAQASGETFELKIPIQFRIK